MAKLLSNCHLSLAEILTCQLPFSCLLYLVPLTLSCMNLGHQGKKILSFEIKFFLFK